MLHTKWHPKDNEQAATLEAGVRQIDSHIVGRRYSFDNAKVAAAKAAALTAMFSLDSAPPHISDVRYSEEKIAGLRTSKLAAPYDKLNILLRAGNAEAFYYWLLAEKYRKG